ncbi:MAG: hypothetical protein AAF127_12145 [Pseudomonadota bacterium]
MAKFASLALALAPLSMKACAPGQPLGTAAAQPTVESPLPCVARLKEQAQIYELSVEAPGDRAVPLTIFAPARAGTFPLIAFSHGAFATPQRYRAMLEPLAGAGFIIIAPMHIDSEEFPRAEGEPERPPHPVTWATRNADFTLALDPPEAVIRRLGAAGLTIDPDRTIALGHSYGALIAQLPGGALAFEPDGTQVSRANPRVDAVVGWSPPGPMPGFMAKGGWSSLTAPSLTLTGTADILPGFIDDWKAHKASHDNAPLGQRAVWVGEGVDHYFGGVFGRIKDQPGAANQALFERALASSLHFIEAHSGASQPCALGPAIAGELYEEDQP